jgi:hypothetical protein
MPSVTVTDQLCEPKAQRLQRLAPAAFKVSPVDSRSDLEFEAHRGRNNSRGRGGPGRGVSRHRYFGRRSCCPTDARRTGRGVRSRHPRHRQPGERATGRARSRQRVALAIEFVRSATDSVRRSTTPTAGHSAARTGDRPGRGVVGPACDSAWAAGSAAAAPTAVATAARGTVAATAVGSVATATVLTHQRRVSG